MVGTFIKDKIIRKHEMLQQHERISGDLTRDGWGRLKGEKEGVFARAGTLWLMLNIQTSPFRSITFPPIRTTTLSH